MLTVTINSSTNRRVQFRMRVTAQNEVTLDIPSRASITVIADILSKQTLFLTKARQYTRFTLPQQITPQSKLFVWGIELQAGTVLSFKKNKSIKRDAIYTTLTPLLEQFISERVSHFIPLMSIRKVGNISYKLVKSQWGSCSRNGNLSFNKRLVHYPKETIEYVVVHELAHIHQHNHSPSFWKIVKQYYPNYKEAKRELRLGRCG